MRWQKILKYAFMILSIVVVLVFTYFVGYIIAGFRYSPPLLNTCMPTENIPYETYDEVPIGRFNQMYRLFYTDGYEFNKIIVPENITLRDYYSSVNYEYFLTEDNSVIKCGIFK